MYGSLAPDLLPSRDAHAAPAAKPATVLLVDGRPLVRECLARGIRAEWPEARLAAIGWDGLAAAGDDVALCLVSMSGGASLEAIRAALPAAALVVLGDDDGYTAVSRAAAQGARGYFTTAVDLAVLVQGMRLVLMGGTAMPLALPARPAASHHGTVARSRFSAELFTPKELEVLQALAKGLPNKLVAHELSICETTVKVHLRHIFRKLGTTNRTHAALLAREMLDGAG